MRKLRALWVRLSGIFGTRRANAELDAELQSHLEMHIDDGMHLGLSPQEARRQALIRLGGLEQAKNAYRERRGLPSLEALVRDLRFATRQLRKSPGFTLVTVLTLALGIGANLTVFLILYGVLLKPLPFPEPQQIVRMERLFPDGELFPAHSGTKALFMMRASRTFESAAAYDYIPSHLNLVQGGEAVPLDALAVTSNFFRVFQMEPQIGHS